MIIPIWDSTLPCPSYPLDIDNSDIQAIRYLGYRALVSGIPVASFNIITNDDSKISSLETFWTTTCNYGLTPFLINAPYAGAAMNPEYPTVLVSFQGKPSTKKDGAIWTATIKINVLGTIAYVIDGDGNFILSDDGDFVIVNDMLVATPKNTSYQGVIYGNY